MAKKMLLLLTLAGLLLPAAAFADQAAWEWGTTGQSNTNGDWTFGQVFTPTQNFTVDFLGYYNPMPMLDVHPVSIWDANGNLIAASTITAASNTTSTHFLYNMITPVTLLAGQTYEITGVSGIDNYAYSDSGFTIFAPINYIGYNFCLGCGDVFTGLSTTDLASETRSGVRTSVGQVPRELLSPVA